MVIIAGLATGGHLCMTRAFKLADVSAIQPAKFLTLIWSALSVSSSPKSLKSLLGRERRSSLQRHCSSPDARRQYGKHLRNHSSSLYDQGTFDRTGLREGSAQSTPRRSGNGRRRSAHRRSNSGTLPQPDRAT